MKHDATAIGRSWRALCDTAPQWQTPFTGSSSSSKRSSAGELLLPAYIARGGGARNES